MNNKKPQIIGYRLKKAYPGSKEVGYFEKFTTGEFSKYPEIWEPVYEEAKRKSYMEAFQEKLQFQMNLTKLVKEYNSNSDFKIKSVQVAFMEE